jgi:uncharacterized protein (TIGR02246 family)
MEQATGNAKDIEAIERLVSDWSRAVESKDAEKIVANYGPDTVLFDAIPPARTIGAREIGRIWAQCLPYFPEKFKSEHKDLTIHVDGDLAVVYGLHHFVPEPADHPSGATWMRMTVVLRRQVSGWQVIHEHVSIPFDPMTSKAVFLDQNANAVAPTELGDGGGSTQLAGTYRFLMSTRSSIGPSLPVQSRLCHLQTHSGEIATVLSRTRLATAGRWRRR